MSDCGCHSVTTLPAYKIGTTWDGLSDFTLTPAHDQPLTLFSVAFIRAGVTILTIDSTDTSKVEILNAAAWIVDIKDQILTAITVKGNYTLEITTTDSTGFIRPFPPIFLPVK